MTYDNITMTGDKDKVRYLLTKEGRRPLIVIGLNPSTASEEKADATMRAVMRIAETNGFDSFIMANLYPQRSTNPGNLHKECDQPLCAQNIEELKKAIAALDKPQVLLAYGNNIYSRPYLKDCLRDIIAALSNFQPTWLRLGELTGMGQPRHPLYSSNKPLRVLDIDDYVKSLKL